MSTTRSDNTTPFVWFAIGRCQYGAEGCREAKFLGQRSMIVSPDFATTKELEAWLTHKEAKTSGLRCRYCKRPIAINFERRPVFVSASEIIDDSARA